MLKVERGPKYFKFLKTLRNTCCEIFLSILTVRVMPKISVQKFVKKYGQQLANIDKHTSKRAPKYLKMTPS